MKFSLPFRRFEVFGESMRPTYAPQDRVVVYTWGRVKQGDVVVCKKNGRTMIKRVLKKENDGYLVGGDNLNQSLEPCEVLEVVGRVVLKY